MRRAASPTSNSAGQTRLPTFSMTTRSRSSSASRCRAERTMVASRWHSPPNHWPCSPVPPHPGGGQPVGIDGRLDVTLDHAARSSGPAVRRPRTRGSSCPHRVTTSRSRPHVGGREVTPVGVRGALVLPRILSSTSTGGRPTRSRSVAHVAFPRSWCARRGRAPRPVRRCDGGSTHVRPGRARAT